MDTGVIGFDHQPRTRLVCGLDAIERLGALARGVGGRKILVVPDPGIVAAGHVERARRALADARVDVTIFDRVRENPTTNNVDECLTAAKAAGIDALAGL